MVAVSACYQKWVRNPTSPESNSPQNLWQMRLHLEKVTHRGVRVWGPIVMMRAGWERYRVVRLEASLTATCL